MKLVVDPSAAPDQGINSPDLPLAELAQRIGAELVTMHVKHFPMFPELKRPYSY